MAAFEFGAEFVALCLHTPEPEPPHPQEPPEPPAPPIGDPPPGEGVPQALDTHRCAALPSGSTAFETQE
jgi:hypothetical protein